MTRLFNYRLILIFGLLFLITGCEGAAESPTPSDYVQGTTILPTPMIFATNTPTATMPPTIVITGTPVARTTRTVVAPTPINWAIRVSSVPLFQQQQTLTCEEA